MIEETLIEINSEKLQAIAYGHLYDLPSNKETHLWLSTHSEDHLTNTPGFQEEPEYTMYRSANRGVAGPLYLLSRLVSAGVELKNIQERAEEAVDWLLAHHDTPDDQLPGLHFGEAGVAVAIAEAVRAGLITSGMWLDEYLDEALNGPLDWPDLTHGAAGQALAALICSDLLNCPDLANHAHRCIEYLIRMQDSDGKWIIPSGVSGMSGNSYTGFAHGVAGIIYSLVEYDQRFPNDRVKKAYISGVEWLSGVANISNNVASWPVSSNNDNEWKWWCHGGPGIALTYLRLFESTNEGKYACFATQALHIHPYEIRHSNLSQCHGLSGIGEIYLEAYRILDQPEWLARAQRIGELLYSLGKYSEEGGLTWPVENPAYPTADLMVGSSGVAHFLLRLSSNFNEFSYPLLTEPSS